MFTSVGIDREPAHDHVVDFYRNDDELISAIAPFLAEALDADGSALVIATPQHRSALDWLLGHRHGYRSFDAAETLASFMRDGAIDPEAFFAVVGSLIDERARTGLTVHAF